jgi:hypothetical protein
MAAATSSGASVGAAADRVKGDFMHAGDGHERPRHGTDLAAWASLPRRFRPAGAHGLQDLLTRRSRKDMDAGSVVVLARVTRSSRPIRAAALRPRSLVTRSSPRKSMALFRDPKVNPNAERFDRLFSEVLSRDLKVMDAAAIALARDNAIRLWCFLHQTGYRKSYARRGSL